MTTGYEIPWDEYAARLAAAEAQVEVADERIDTLRDELAYAIRTRDEWEANAEDADAAIARVRALMVTHQAKDGRVPICQLRTALDGAR